MADNRDLSKLQGEKNPFNKYDKKYTSLKVWLIAIASFVLLVVLFFIAKGLLSYTLDFDTMGGSRVESQTLTFLEIMEMPDEIPTKSGYYLAGWTKDKAGTKPFPFGSKIWWSTTAYAKWEDGVAIVLEFADGEENEDLSIAQLKGLYEEWLKPGSADELPLVINQNENSLHYGERLLWFEDEDCSGQPLYSKTYTLASSVTVYGKWFDTDERKYDIDESGVLNTYNGYCKNLVLPASVKSIRGIESNKFVSSPDDHIHTDERYQSVFKNVMSSMQSIYLNDGLEYIGECAFRDCTKLNRVEFTNGVSHSSLKSIGGYAFKGTKLKSFYTPNTTTIIGEYAFHGIIQLKSFDFGGVKTIGKCALGGTSLENITLRGVETIEAEAFSGCNSLKALYLLAPHKISVTSVGDSKNGTSETWNNVLYGSGAYNFRIYIPKNLMSTYSSDALWGIYSDKFVEYAM